MAMNLSFDDVKKQNLISVLFSLECVVDGITKYTEDKFSELQTIFSNQLRHVTQACSALTPCSKEKYVVNWCFTCSSWRTTILCQHRNKSFIGKNGSDWSRINSSKWPTDPKEVEKCFNPDWCNSMKGTAPSLDDVSVVIGKILNCEYLRSEFLKHNIDPDIIRQIRNKVHHSREIKQAEKKVFCDQMITFLRSPNVGGYQEAKDACDKVQIFKENDYIDIYKDKIINEYEINKMKARIAASWGKCYSVSILTLGVLIFAILVPIIYLGCLEISKTIYFAEIMILLRTFFREQILPPGNETCGNVTFVSRQEWGARAPRKFQKMPVPMSTVFVHHTAGLHCNSQQKCSSEARSVQSFHMNGNKWDDIGYNFLIGEDGRVYECRGWDRVGAHTLGWNNRAISFSFMGNYNDKAPDPAAMKALENAICVGVKKGKIDPDYRLKGHRDARPTDSPGHYLYMHIQHLEHFDNSSK